VDKTVANPGDTLTYTLVVKNTGETDLTNVKIVDKLPAYVTYISGSTTVNGVKVADGVTSAGLTIAKLEKGATATIKFQVKVAAVGTFKCNNLTKLINTVTSSADGVSREDNANNNSATTTVTVQCVVPKPCPTNPNISVDDPKCKPCPTNPDLNYDDPECKPCQYNPNLNYDDPLCLPPTTGNGNNNNNNNVNVNNNNNSSSSNSNASVVVNLVTSGGQVTTSDGKSYTPSTIVATGPVEAMAAIIGTGALTFGAVAYLRSRKNLLNKLMNQ
jgi:uncharacterized repeat protein (TIGR01451 family)